jgi:hypothetical protein
MATILLSTIVKSNTTRALTGPYLYVRIRPRRIQAWRGANELGVRDLKRDGQWLDSGAEIIPERRVG